MEIESSSVNVCKRGHIAARYADGSCKECRRLHGASTETKAARAVARRKPANLAAKSAYDLELYRNKKDRIRERVKAHCATPRGRARELFRKLVKRAAKKQMAVGITWEWLEGRIASGRCELTGVPFDLSRYGSHGPYAPSVDRIDSSRGYELDNCRVILWALNMAFSNWGEETFAPIAIALLAARGGK
jgi:hypothetical protein